MQGVTTTAVGDVIDREATIIRGRQREIARPAMAKVVATVATAFGTKEEQIRHGHGGAERMVAAWMGSYEGLLTLPPIAAGRSFPRTTERFSFRTTPPPTGALRELTALPNLGSPLTALPAARLHHFSRIFDPRHRLASRSRASKVIAMREARL